MKASEGDFTESVVYVTTQGTQVRTEGGRITVHDVNGDRGKLASFPTEQVETLNVFGGVNFTTPFVARANEHGIVLNYFTQHGAYRGSFVPERNTIAEVRRAQYGLAEDRELEIAKSMIAAKIRNSRTLLGRKDVRDTSVLKNLGDKATKVSSKDELRGVEGEAAERYFNRLDETLTDEWTFETRTKRPPEDHINSLLSLTYTFCKNEVLTALRAYNLDPFLGILHADRHGRPSLALDLQEEFRPIFCDAFVTRLVNRGTITHNQFTDENRLTDAGFKEYLSKFESYITEDLTHPHFGYSVTRREAIRKQAILLRKAITGELDSYHPFEVNR
jgi:CRISPR-associated protein Cas1